MNIFGFDREQMTDAEWSDYVIRQQGEAIFRQEVQIRELKRETEHLQGRNLSSPANRKVYLPRPISTIDGYDLQTPRNWCHAIADKAYEARRNYDAFLKVDTSLQASIEGRIFSRNADEFGQWARNVTEIIALGLAWLDSAGVKESARAGLFKEFNDNLEAGK